jgi:hypothetical protein
MEDDTLTPEEIKSLRKFKANLFDLYWDNFGFFYIHVVPHPELQMGNRGLLGKEKEAGVVLAIGPTACREIASEEDSLYAELQFGLKWEKLIIPWDSIFRIFDKTQNSLTQLRTIKELPDMSNVKTGSKPKTKSSKKVSDSNVIEIDFSKKR